MNGITFIAFRRIGIVIPVLIFLISCSKKQDTGWRVYGGNSEATRFTVLDQINKSNVKDLQVAWTYRTGDNDTSSAEIQCNPIVVNGIMYVTSPKLKLIALDAATGKELWKFDPFENMKSSVHANRGVVYWESGEDKRILYSAGSHLLAINALTGKPVDQFGEHGAIDLHEGLDADVKDLFVIATTPGIVYHDLLILGSRVSENSDAAPGHIRAFDIRTGKRQWIFHTIPKAGEA
ncbi:MAG TPA: PQQ-binding-like beta-propeller repeat protein, partial [Cyclobacteriaceae bacterium]